ncbi:hypothetical protein [Pontibacter harenae]|uniref:hypothetical protein n=1 Tax=Pontibacter harenae TaxID=2894083 RepID=UPI001E3382C5|nr:hypothetical protein [Pontibacter harenae]MCC9168629.1 hypothetical protein [Pontibacter harenae]
MQTLTNQKQPLTKQQGRKGQQAKQPKVNSPKKGGNEEQTQQGESLYGLIGQDEQLRACHTQKLLDTLGYSHLSADEASDIVEQMLRLCTLMYEMLLEQGQNREEEKSFTTESAATEAKQKATEIKRISKQD